MIYNLFISHSWAYADTYDRLLELLSSNPRFIFRNYSVPWDDPIDDARSTKELKEAIFRQMQPASCVIVLAGVYATYSEWINIEVELAKSMGKKIIAVEPRGSQKTSTFVKDHADIIVGWNSNSIISAIRSY